MGYQKLFLVILAHILYLCNVCATVPRDQTEHVKVEVDSSQIVFQVDPALYSVGLGCNLIFTTAYNLSSPVLRLLAKELAPAYVRLGGTYCDFLTFRSHADGIQEEYKNKTLSGKVWDAINDFVSSAGFHFIFDASVFLRTSDNKWNPSNFQELLKYNAKRGYKVDFQLGNEPNAFPFKFNKTITPEALAGDYKMLHTILKQSKLYQDSLVIGPDTTHVLKPNAREYLKGFLKDIRNTLDVISTHFYYTVADRESLVKAFTDPSTLDQFSANTAIYIDTVEKYGLLSSNKPQIWYGESGIQPGSYPMVNVSDRFISGMVWLDKLGICALNDIKVIVRQSLFATIGRRLITVDEMPTADYWSAVLFKRLVGTESLKLHKVGSGDGLDRLRLYAHCTQTDRSVYGYKPGAVTVFGANFNLFKAVRLELNAEDVDQFLLTPARTNNITSLYVALNGIELSADKGSLPDMLPQAVTSKPIFPAGSMGFFVLKDAEFRICKKQQGEK